MRYQISSLDLLKQLLQQIPEDDSCMEWPRSKTGGGYGGMKLGKVHRIAYALAVKPIPEGHDVLHKCDNPPCFRPDHLFTGTAADNIEDCRTKGRMKRSHSETHYAAKLTNEGARRVRVLRAEGMTQEAIAAEVGISRSVVNHIINGRRWTHV